MNMKNNLRYYFPVIVAVWHGVVTACEDDVTVGQEVDESQYENVTNCRGCWWISLPIRIVL